MPVVKINQQFVTNSLMCPEGKKRIEFCDWAVPGFFIEVRATSPNQGTYFFRYKNAAGITTTKKIGRTTDVSLVDAAKEALELRGNVFAGCDPRAEEKARRAIPTVTEFFDDTYLPYAKVHKRSWKRDVQLFARIKAAFGNLRLDQVQKQKVAVFHAALMESEGLSAASADHHPKLLRRMFSMAIEYEIIERNPLSKFSLFNHDNKVENYLDDEQLGKLMDVLRTDANRPACNIAILLLCTGCRLNEILSAKKSDISIESRTLKIAAINAKGKRVRSVPLNDAAIDIILKQLDDTKGYEYLFINHQTGLPYTTVMKVWTRLREKAGLPHLRLHDLRHSFASFLVNSGRTLYEVQQILGHSQSIVTERYAHLSTKTLQAASNSASVMIKAASTTPVVAVQKIDCVPQLDIVQGDVVDAVQVALPELQKAA